MNPFGRVRPDTATPVAPTETHATTSADVVGSVEKPAKSDATASSDRTTGGNTGGFDQSLHALGGLGRGNRRDDSGGRGGLTGGNTGGYGNTIGSSRDDRQGKCSIGTKGSDQAAGGNTGRLGEASDSIGTEPWKPSSGPGHSDARVRPERTRLAPMTEPKRRLAADCERRSRRNHLMKRIARVMSIAVVLNLVVMSTGIARPDLWMGGEAAGAAYAAPNRPGVKAEPKKAESHADSGKAEPKKSDRQIAETVKASPTTVGAVRREVEPTVQSGQLRVGKDGKARKQPARKPAHEPRRPAQKKREIIVERKALVHALIILDRGFAETLAKFFQNYPDQLDAFFADLTIFLDDGNDDPDASAAAMKAKFAEADAAAAGDPTDPGPTPESLRRGEP